MKTGEDEHGRLTHTRLGLTQDIGAENSLRDALLLHYMSACEIIDNRELTFRGVLETQVRNGTKQFRLQQKIPDCQRLFIRRLRAASRLLSHATPKTALDRLAPGGTSWSFTPFLLKIRSPRSCTPIERKKNEDSPETRRVNPDIRPLLVPLALGSVRRSWRGERLLYSLVIVHKLFFDIRARHGVLAAVCECEYRGESRGNNE